MDQGDDLLGKVNGSLKNKAGKENFSRRDDRKNNIIPNLTSHRWTIADFKK